MACVGRTPCLARIFPDRAAVLHHHHRHTFRLPALEVRRLLPLAFRHRSRRRGEFNRLPEHPDECSLDSLRLVGDRCDPSGLRTPLLHHHRRHPVRCPAFQDRHPLPASLRQDLPAQLKFFTDYRCLYRTLAQARLIFTVVILLKR